MSYSKKDIANKIKKEKKNEKKAEEIMNEIDEAFDKMNEDEKKIEKEKEDIDEEDTTIEKDKEEITEEKEEITEEVVEDNKDDDEEEKDEIDEIEEKIEESQKEAVGIDDEVKEDKKDDDDDDDEEIIDRQFGKTRVEKDKEFWGDTTVIDTGIMDKIEEEFEEDLKSFKKDKPTVEKDFSYKNHISTFLLILICVAIFFSVTYFVSVLLNHSPLSLIINTGVLALFSFVYLATCITSNRKGYIPVYISTILLIFFFIFNMNSPTSTNKVSTKKLDNLSGKSLAEVVKWADKNDVKIIQEYEYSDMIPEYEIISQSVDAGTNINDVDEITVAISEGPNPYKEVIIPSMLTWDAERVVKYVLNNYLSNVNVEFVESDQVKDTVIEQSKSGNLMRNEELNLTFSYGDEGNSDEVTLIDFTNMTKFEIEFYMKQHKLNYDFVYDFSDSIKKDRGVSQSIEAGEIVKVDGDKIQITISRGPKITIPDLTNKSIEDITNWAIENHLKLEFIDKYDDSIKKGQVISVDKEKDEVVEQGTMIQVTVSLGTLKMPKFKSIDEFYKWADKYGIKYEIRREFNKDVNPGEVISYSYKTGEVIKNDDAIIVTISDGKNVEVPSLKGLTKSEATSKLKKAGLKYNFIYKNSNSKKDTVINQSLSAGSEVSSGTTVTVTLSNGKSGGNEEEYTPSPKPSTSPKPTTSPKPSTSPSPTPSCNSCSVLGSGIKNTIVSSVNEDAGYTGTANAVISYIEGKCPGINVQVRKVTGTGKKAGTFLPDDDNGHKSWNGGSTTSCETVYIYLAG